MGGASSRRHRRCHSAPYADSARCAEVRRRRSLVRLRRPSLQRNTELCSNAGLKDCACPVLSCGHPTDRSCAAGYGCVDHRCKLISRHVRGRQLTFGQRKWWCQLNAYSEDCDAEFMLGRLASVLVPSHSSNPPLLSWLWPHSPNRRTTLRRAALPKHPSICYVHINKAGGAALTTGLQRLQRQGMVSRVAELHIPWSFGPTPWYRTKAANASWKPGPWKPGWYFPPGPLRMDSCLGYEIVLCGYEIRSTASSRPSSFLGWKEMEAQVVWKP